ncbi:MAG: hypothetical protein E6R03_12190 [Hyphomicrobiaceae bacterium]|nr:MAG: hypothetical protein E6R03_12190 [Hyphomicrobiaceae bacterium]
MITDKQARFEWDGAITVTAVSTDKIDLAVVNRDLGMVDDLYIVGVVTTAFTAAGAATLACDLIGDDNASLSSPTTLQTLMAATGKATLIAGYTMFKAKFALGKITERYLGLQWTVATGPMTAGAVKAFLCRGVDHQIYYPRGYVNH